jgi:hypothetical protein
MKNKILILSIFMFSIFVFSSCKYEDGPFISFYSKKARVEGYWKFEKVKSNDEDLTSDYENQIIQFMKSGKCIWYLDVNYSNMYNMDPDYTEVGYWDLQDNKEELFLDFVTQGKDPFTHSWEILQLKFHDMRLERYEDEKKIVWELSKMD